MNVLNQEFAEILGLARLNLVQDYGEQGWVYSACLPHMHHKQPPSASVITAKPNVAAMPPKAVISSIKPESIKAESSPETKKTPHKEITPVSSFELQRPHKNEAIDLSDMHRIVKEKYPNQLIQEKPLSSNDHSLPVLLIDTESTEQSSSFLNQVAKAITEKLMISAKVVSFPEARAAILTKGVRLFLYIPEKMSEQFSSIPHIPLLKTEEYLNDPKKKNQLWNAIKLSCANF